MPWTRRNVGREIVAALTWPFGMFTGKAGKPSMLRVIIFGSAVAFWREWPSEWSDPARDALALILFALPLADLFAMIPAAEALAAMQSFFMATVGKVSGLIPGTTVKSSSSSVETTVPAVVPVAPVVPATDADAVDQPPEK